MKMTKFKASFILHMGFHISSLVFWGYPALNAQTCNCDAQQADQDSIRLIEFFNNMGGGGWNQNDGWGEPDIPVSEWHGISGTTEDGCIVCLDLDGELNSPVLGVCQVFSVDPPGNNVTGAWPENYCLPCLIRLSVSSNYIGESFPDFSCFTELEELYLEKVGITDTIPESLLTLENLAFLSLGDNYLYGNIPSDLPERLSNLVELYLDNNNLSGLVPDFSVNSGLNALNIIGNKFTFQDILPYITQIENVEELSYFYHNQDFVYVDTTFIVGLGLPFTINLEIDDTVTTSTYKWYHDGIPFDSVFVNDYQFGLISEESAGSYYCEINNAIATELTLFSRVIQIETCTPAILDISETLCPGEVLDLGNGMVFDRDTLIIFRRAAADGCDSALFVQLAFHDPSLFSLDTTICEGSALSLGGFLYGEAGMYQDTLFGAGANGCDSILAISLFIASEETLGSADAGEDIIVCDPEVMLNASFPPTGTLGYWKAPGFIILSDAADPFAVASELQPGENILWWFLGAPGCNPFDSAFVELYFEPKPTAMADFFTLHEFEILDTNIVANDSNLDFLLDLEAALVSLPERGTVALDSNGRLTYYPEKGYWGIQTFQYILSSSRCEGDITEVTLEIIPKLDRTRPPNVITPNGDNYNETFVIPALYDDPLGYLNSRLSIYTPDGECVFTADGYKNDWGGESQKGNPLPDGVYYFVFYYDYDKPPVERGSVLIIR